MSHPSFPRNIAVLGSTGFIGQKALDVVARYPERFRVAALAAGSSVDLLAGQARRFGADTAVVADPERAGDLARDLPAGCRGESGAEAVAALAARADVDLVVNGIVGAAGLEASLAALRAGKMLALANKESLVLAGELLAEAAASGGGAILPVDSEHSGLFQCLDGHGPSRISRLIITASGGPFRGRSRDSLDRVTPEEALAHPVWPMGRRITVDSATLMNKGLEVIETYRLFDVPLDRIEVWVHPQSVVHALVEWADGSLLAQLSAPDMLLPVQYAMSYPERWPAEAPACRLPDWKELRFEMPDHETFPALRLAIRAAGLGGTAPAVLNAADEVAVEAFLAGRLPFLEIVELVASVLDTVPVRPADSIRAVLAADREAREAARERLEARTP